MSFGSRMVEARKAKGMSQDALAKELDATKTTIGRYERDEVKPSVEVAVKIAATLDISLDYLSGLSDTVIEKDTLRRVLMLQGLSKENREHVFALMDAFLRDTNARELYTQ